MASDEQSPSVGVPLGEVIGGYRLIRLIGAGSTSHVYLGHHVRLRRPGAIKVLHADLVDNPKVVHRMLTEARVVNDIRHPNIVDIADFVDQLRPRRVALIMEYVAGPSVDALRGGEPLPWRQALGIARQLVDAVEAAHRAGVIHRDLKPDNLLLATEPRGAPHVIPQLKVVDFGIAKVAGPTKGHETATQTMLGTPAYMAPEQIAQSPPPSGATDVFAVGEILYELLSGQRAYRSAKLADVVRQKLRGEIPTLPLPLIPGRAELQRLIRRCLAFRPEERPTLDEVVGLLTSVQSMPEPRARDSVGAATVSPVGWNERGGPSPVDLLSEATQLNDVTGIVEQQTQAGWRPSSTLEEETVGTSSPTHLALPAAERPGRSGVGALEMTEPFSADEHALPESALRASSRPFDFDDRAILNAETAMSAEAIPADEAAARAPVPRAPSYEELPTRDVLPSLSATDDDKPSRPRFVSGVEPSDTVVAPTYDPLAPSSADRLPLVPARDGGPPVAADDPLAKPRASTVIRPKLKGADDQGDAARGGRGGPPPAQETAVSVPSMGSAAGTGGRAGARAGWQQTLDRAIQARSPPPPAATPSDAAPTAPTPGQRSAEAKVITRVERVRAARPFLLWPFAVAVFLAVVVVVVRSAGPGASSPTAEPGAPAVQVKSEPPHAFVEDAKTGELLGKTPCAVAVPAGGIREVRVFKVGFVARVVPLRADAPSTWVPLAAE